MRLSCQKAFLILLVSTIACRDSTAPPERVSASFVLQSVSGPTFTASLDYRLHGDQIEIGSFTPCGPGDLCAANATGTLSNGTLTLNNPLPAPNKIYVYTTALLI
jgi:hypothetical protein